jgi:hypothetical protein
MQERKADIGCYKRVSSISMPLSRAAYPENAILFANKSTALIRRHYLSAEIIA